MNQEIVTNNWREMAEEMAVFLRKTREKPRDAADMIELDRLLKRYVKLDPKFNPTLIEG